MANETSFTMTIEAELRDAFLAEAAADERPAAQVVRDLMRDYVQRRREERAYDAYLGRKVAAAREQVAQGLTYANEDVEAEFAARRKEAAERTGGC